MENTNPTNSILFFAEKSDLLALEEIVNTKFSAQLEVQAESENSCCVSLKEGQDKVVFFELGGETFKAGIFLSF